MRVSDGEQCNTLKIAYYSYLTFSNSYFFLCNPKRISETPRVCASWKSFGPPVLFFSIKRVSGRFLKSHRKSFYRFRLPYGHRTPFHFSFFNECRAIKRVRVGRHPCIARGVNATTLVCTATRRWRCHYTRARCGNQYVIIIISFPRLTTTGCACDCAAIIFNRVEMYRVN